METNSTPMVRLREDDAKLIDYIKKNTGITTTIDTIRFSLRETCKGLKDGRTI